jgi:hypothetical protein
LETALLHQMKEKWQEIQILQSFHLNPISDDIHSGWENCFHSQNSDVISIHETTVISSITEHQFQWKSQSEHGQLDGVSPMEKMWVAALP